MRGKYRAIGGCLPCGADPVAKSEPSSFDEGEPAWKFLKAIFEAARGLKPRFQNLNLVPYLLLGLD